MFANLLFIFSVFAPGLAVGASLYPRLINGRQLLSLAFGIGSAVITFELFFYFVIARLPFSSALLWFFGLQSAVALVIFAWQFPWRRQMSIEITSIKAVSWILSLLIFAILAAGLIKSLANPPVVYDSIAFWASRAQILIKEGRVNFDSASSAYLSALTHSNYPWHLSLLEYWARVIGVKGGGVNIISWLYFSSLVMLVVDVGIRWLGKRKGLLLGLFIATQPLLFYHATNNYADLIVGYYAAAGCAFFLSWLDEGKRYQLMLAVGLSAWTFSVKNYGSFYIIALIVGCILSWLLKVRRWDWKKLGWALMAFGPILPIALFKAFNKLNLRNTEAAWVWQPQALKPFLSTLFLDGNWNIWWYLVTAVFFCSLLYWRRYRVMAIAWCMLATIVGILMVIFTVTENYQWSLDYTALPRSFIPVAAMSAVVIAYTGRYLGNDKK